MDQTDHPLRPLRGGCAAPFAALLVLLAACAPPPDTTRPGFAFAPRWLAPVPAGARPLADNALWWQAFRDPALDRLIRLALADSPSLAAAQARARAARAAVAAIPGAVTLSGGTAVRGSDASSDPGLARASADLSLDVLFDPGRGRASDRAAAGATAAQAQAQAAGARLFLLGEVADAYVALRLAQRRLALTEAEAARRRQTLALAETLAEAGAATRVEALRSEGRLAEIAADLPGLAAAVAGGQARLAVLAGRAPGTLPPDLAAALAARGAEPRATLAPDPGIPADLLRNRPDLAVAEAAYDAARAGVGQARSALYPRLSLSGVIEASADRDDRFRSATLGPALRLPTLPLGPARAGVSAAEARVAAAHADWTEAVLQALLEVEIALLDYRAAAASEGAAERAVRLYGEAASLTRELAARGEVTLGDLIDAEEELARAETARAEARATRARAFIALNIRLGAGARAAADPAADPAATPATPPG